MTEHSLGEIRVNPRTIIIGDEVIALAEIARLKVMGFVDKNGFGRGVRFTMNAGLALLLYGLVLLGAFGRLSTSLSTPVILIGLGIVIGALMYANSGPYMRVLLIEMSSGGFNALSAQSFDPLRQLQYDIATFIENPPSEPTTLNIGNVISTVDLRGAQGIQFGNHNSQSNQSSRPPVV